MDELFFFAAYPRLPPACRQACPGLTSVAPPGLSEFGGCPTRRTCAWGFFPNLKKQIPTRDNDVWGTRGEKRRAGGGKLRPYILRKSQIPREVFGFSVVGAELASARPRRAVSPHVRNQSIARLLAILGVAGKIAAENRLFVQQAQDDDRH